MIELAIDIISGETVLASFPDSPQRALCIHCRREVYKRCSPKKIWHYAHMPSKEKHLDICINREKDLVLRSITMTDAEHFHRRVELVQKRTTYIAGGRTQKTPFPKEERTLAINSLKGLWENGWHISRNIKINEGWLTDIIIGIPNRFMLLNDYEPRRRVLIGRPKMLSKEKRIIRFCCYIPKDIRGTDIFRFKVLDMHVGDEELFEILSNVFFRVEMDRSSMKSKVVPVCDAALLHGDWVNVSRESCKKECTEFCAGKWRCEGKLYAEINNKQQVFCIPNRGAESDALQV